MSGVRGVKLTRAGGGDQRLPKFSCFCAAGPGAPARYSTIDPEKGTTRQRVGRAY